MRLSALTVLALAGAISAAAPAVAQPHHPPHDRPWREDGRRAWDLGSRIDWLQHRINRGRDDGSLDRREAHRVQVMLDEIRLDRRRMERRNGGYLTRGEREMLQDRLDRLNGQIRWLRHNDEVRPW